ncbi:hypothetical protein [Algoriphagus sp.]|uniref:hypothetical protein n=1 Tax=Algoriphagus sp. TaxID=1872435 RepID=UPI0032936650
MTRIDKITVINSSIERCFDLARDIDFHKLSAQKTKETAIAGKMEGLCELGDSVTWKANHFWLRQHLSVKITKFERPFFLKIK